MGARWRLQSVGLILMLLQACLPAASQDRPAATASPSAPVALASSSLAPLQTLKVGSHTVQIELACTAEEQQLGLMHRDKLPQHQGMLFVFDRERPLSFWMKNTRIPLSIAYINASGVIVDVQDMQPFDETPHPTAQPAQYALEMNQGWFAGRGIQVGERIQLDSFCSDR